MARKLARKELVRASLISRLGEWVANQTLRELAGCDDVPRAIRELRAEGYVVETDRRGHWRILDQPLRKPVQRANQVSGAQRQRILDRDGRRCRACGYGAGEVDPDGYVVRLAVHHVQHRQYGGATTDDNLETLCLRCHNERHALENGRLED